MRKVVFLDKGIFPMRVFHSSNSSNSVNPVRTLFIREEGNTYAQHFIITREVRSTDEG